MAKKMSPNDNQFREIVIREIAAEHGENQQGDKMYKDVDQA